MQKLVLDIFKPCWWIGTNKGHYMSFPGKLTPSQRDTRVYTTQRKNLQMVSHWISLVERTVHPYALIYTLTIHNWIMGSLLFYWFVFFAFMCHSLLTISKIDRPSPVWAWLCRKDWLCRDTPRGSAWKRGAESSQMFWTAWKSQLRYKNQMKKNKRLNHQDATHEATVD